MYVVETVGNLLAEMTTARAGGRALLVTASDSTRAMVLRKGWRNGGGRRAMGDGREMN